MRSPATTYPTRVTPDDGVAPITDGVITADGRTTRNTIHAALRSRHDRGYDPYRYMRSPGYLIIAIMRVCTHCGELKR